MTDSGSFFSIKKQGSEKTLHNFQIVFSRLMISSSIKRIEFGSFTIHDQELRCFSVIFAVEDVN